MILLDTNVLARVTRSHDPQCPVARRAIQALLSRGEKLAVVPQNLYEFWAIATRAYGAPPAGRNGLGMSTAQAGHWLRFFQRRFTLLHDREELCRLWQRLVETYGITSFRAHDVRLVAAMQSYRITQMLSFNGADFRRLPITVVDPSAL
jgi:predicted nucleic acid-binding protein